MNPHVEVEIARRYLVDAWQGFSHMPGENWGVDRQTIPQGQNGGDRSMAKRWNNLPDRILTASPHLQGYDVPGDEIDRLKAEGLTLLEALERLGIA